MMCQCFLFFVLKPKVLIEEVKSFCGFWGELEKSKRFCGSSRRHGHIDAIESVQMRMRGWKVIDKEKLLTAFH